MICRRYATALLGAPPSTARCWPRSWPRVTQRSPLSNSSPRGPQMAPQARSPSAAVAGLIEGVCAALGLTVSFLTPPAWKRSVGIAPGKAGAKDAARSEALRRWPSHATFFARARDDGRAEAALIAAAGLTRDQSKQKGKRSHEYER